MRVEAALAKVKAGRDVHPNQVQHGLFNTAMVLYDILYVQEVVTHFI